MKKIFMILAVAVAMLTSCEKQSDFNKYLTSDYELVKAQYPEQEVVFCEAQATLNGSPSELGMKAEPVSVREIFQVIDTALVVYVDRTYAKDTCVVSEHMGYWGGDVHVTDLNFVDYKKALKTLLTVKGEEVPDAVFMTLREPLGPVAYDNPFYVFGSNLSSFIAIDARTLDVLEFTLGDGEEEKAER